MLNSNNPISYDINDYNSDSQLLYLQQIIQDLINQLNFDSACFLSELYYNLSNNNKSSSYHIISSTYLYSLSLFLINDYNTSFNITKKNLSLSNIGITYIYAKSSLKLRKDLKNSFHILNSLINSHNSSSQFDNLIFWPNLSTINLCLANLSKFLSRNNDSAFFYSTALSINPFLWEAIISLCDLKISIDLNQFNIILNTNNNIINKPLNFLYLNFIKIYYYYSSFNSYKSIRILANFIPPQLRDNMPWSLKILALLQFNIQNYKLSLKYFKKLYSIQSTILSNFEIFSTVLWHLKDTTLLSNLSKKFIENYPNNPISWCFLGNYLSLKNDHDGACKSFKKATTIDPFFTYAYTLQGHELSTIDSFDSAKNCFRNAIACDQNHYNAYYGLGKCYMRLGQYNHALLYFEKAKMINPTNVVLICCCGIALEKLDQNNLALDYYNLACNLQPNSTLSKFKKAQLLYSMGRFNLALNEFENLIVIEPDEPTAHFILGQIYLLLGRKKDAINELTIAMNLDPKGSQIILNILEKINDQ